MLQITDILTDMRSLQIYETNGEILTDTFKRIIDERVLVSACSL